MARRKIIDEHEARACLAEAEQSGMTAGQWAKPRGIDGRSLNAWRMNLERRDIHAPLRLVELLPTAVSPPDSPLRVTCGRFVVEVPPDFDEGVLARLLDVVSSAC